MPVNPYFSAGKGQGTKEEQNFMQDLVDEFIQVNGHDFVYCPREDVNIDHLFGEDVLAAFKSHFVIEMYPENVNIYGGRGDILSKFGLEITDTFDLVVSRRRFEMVTGMATPREGDLIYFPAGRALFEVRFMEDELPFYQLGKLCQFKLSCELFTYSQEKMETGYSDIDLLGEAIKNNDNTDGDPFADNDAIEEVADEYIDFSEAHPFGEYGNKS